MPRIIDAMKTEYRQAGDTESLAELEVAAASTSNLDWMVFKPNGRIYEQVEDMTADLLFGIIGAVSEYSGVKSITNSVSAQQRYAVLVRFPEILIKKHLDLRLNELSLAVTNECSGWCFIPRELRCPVLEVVG